SPESADRGEKAQTATTNGPKRDAETKSRLAIEVARQAALVTALTRATFRKSICSLTLRKSFGDLEVLKGINLTVRKGEAVSVIGPSGSGKSTMLRCLNYLEEPTAGSIYID